MTYGESRNHSCCPRRSESAAIASRYRAAIEFGERRAPYGGRSDEKPESGAGGGVRMDSTGRWVVDGGSWRTA